MTMIMLINLFFSLNLLTKPVNLNQYSYLLLRPEEKKLTGTVFKDKRKKYLNLDKYRFLSLQPKKDKVKLKLASARQFAPGPKTKKVLIPAPFELEILFDKYSQQYGVAKKLLKKIARCESGFNPRAVNGPYGGMYQFLISTWQSNRRAMGLDPHPDLRFNSEEAIKTTAFKISRDGTAAWPVCGQ